MPRPPHLRACNPCENCRHYDGNGKCLMYEYPVDDDDTCDSFAKAGTQDRAKRLWAAHRRRLTKGA